MGVRGLEYSKKHSAYFLIAGPHDNEGSSRLYRWSGPPNSSPELVASLDGFNPEALLMFPGTEKILLLSDDGTEKEKEDRKVVDCKDLTDSKAMKFRSRWLDISSPK